MKLARHRRTTFSGFNMTPMIDIVFLLIIFFMTVSQISRTTGRVVELPRVGAGGKPLETISITLTIDEKGNYLAGDRTMGIDEVIRGVSAEFDRVERRPENLRILVRCDRNAPGSHFNELSRRLDALGIRQVSVSIQLERN
jgi:biopolymer transport protein ExbD